MATVPLPTRPRVAGEIGVLGRDRADRWPRPGQLREGQRHIHERPGRGAADGRAVALIQVRREHAGVPAHDRSNGRNHGHSSMFVS